MRRLLRIPKGRWQLRWSAHLPVALTITAFVVLAAISVALLLSIYGQADMAQRNALRHDAFKAALAFLTVGLLGSLVSFVLAELNRQRQRLDAEQQFRSAILKQMRSCYAMVVTARWRLGMKACSATEFDRSIYALRDAKVQLAELRLDLEVSQSIIGSARRIGARLGAMERHLGHILAEYQRRGPVAASLPAGALDERYNFECRHWPALCSFLGVEQASSFRAGFHDHYRSALMLLQREVL
jgi:hypothetical protein